MIGDAGLTLISLSSVQQGRVIDCRNDELRRIRPIRLCSSFTGWRLLERLVQLDLSRVLGGHRYGAAFPEGFCVSNTTSETTAARSSVVPQTTSEPSLLRHARSPRNA